MTTDRHLDHDTTTALRQLDPAGGLDAERPAPLTPSERDRAELTLQRVLSSDPDPALGSTHGASAPSGSGELVGSAASRDRRTRRWWPVWLGVVALTAALVVPGLFPGRDLAYASWTAKPAALTSTASADAVDACLKAHDRSGGPAPEPLIAERRGAWTYVLIPLTGDLEASCIMPADAITNGRPPRNGDWFGGIGNNPPVTVGARYLKQMISGIGSTSAGLLRYTEGVAGRDVVAVTITTPRGGVVAASVNNGRYAAWWPAGADKITNPEISGAATFEVTLRDGTTSREPPG